MVKQHEPRIVGRRREKTGRPNGRTRQRAARQPNRRLWFEALEDRIVLSGRSMVELAAASGFSQPFPTGLGHADPLVQAAIANVTTTGSQLTYSVDLPQIKLESGGEIQPSLSQSRDLINLNDFRADPRFVGINGSGFSVVILDTGIDLNHPFFGPDADFNGVADRIVYNQDFITGGPNADDVNGHGTHVSSTIGGQDATYSGMAPGVNIIHLQVLNDGGGGTGAALENALQWVVANVSTYNIASINMSLGFNTNDGSPNPHPEIGISDELAAIAAQNVIIASASGNSFGSFSSTPGVAYPSADPSSLSIGATWDANAGGPFGWSGSTDFTTGPDRLVSFSQRHPTMTTVFAPGALITAAAIGGGIVTYSGTSMATPHVAGIAALMQQLAMQELGRRLTQAEFATLIDNTGMAIFDGDDENDSVINTNQWYHRVDVLALANAIESEGLSDITIPTALTLSSPAASPGGVARLSFTLANQSNVDTGVFSTGIYLSTDATVDASDTLLTSFSESIAPGGISVHQGLTVAMPGDLAPGSYFIGVVADRLNVVTEGLETNNVASLPLTITAPAPEIRVSILGGVELADGAGSVAFGTINQGAPDVVRTFEIINDGPVQLDLGAITLPTGFSSLNLPASVAALSSAQFTITMSGAAGGNFSGTASFSTNDLNENPFNFTVSGVVQPPDDHGNSAAFATPLVLPTTTSGIIEQLGDQDWFSFSTVAGRNYQFLSTLITLGDSFFELYAPNGTTLLVSDDDSGPGLASFISWFAPTSDTYYLKVRAYLNAGTGAYSVAFSEFVPDDHGDFAFNSTFTTDPSTIAGTLGTTADIDWFRFEAVEGVTYDVTTALGTLDDSILTLYDINGFTQLAYNDNDGVSLASHITWTAPKDGFYYIEVGALGSFDTGTYTLSIEGDDDHGDNLASATYVAGSSVSGEIEVPYDVDWFEFDAIGGARYLFETSLGTLTDSVLALYDSNGFFITSDDDGGVGLASLIDWFAPSDGTYYLEVNGLNWRTGTYDLSLTVVDDHGNNAAAATPIAAPGIAAGVIAPIGDKDWFSFTAVAGVDYVFSTSLFTLPDSVLRLIGANGVTQLAKNDDDGANLSSRIEWTAPASGVYYLEVSGFDTSVGTYDLRVLPDLNLVVDTLADEFDGNFTAGDLSLREAVEIAQFYPSGEAITFAPSLFGQTLALTLGEIFIGTGVNIQGPGANQLTIQAFDPTPSLNNGDGSRIFYIASPAPVSLSGLTLTGGDTFGDGGAIIAFSALNLSNMVISENYSGNVGGGIYQGAGRLEVIETTIDGNSSFHGGGLFVAAELLIDRSTISGNTAIAEGGGLYFSYSSFGPVPVVRNTTISGNTASQRGGGVRNSFGVLRFEHSTISANTSSSNFGAGVSSWGLSNTRSEFYSSIVAGNVGTDVDFFPDSTNSFASSGYNLIGSGNAVAAFNQPGDQTSANPLLAPLADNGGPTRTHSLLAGSPAINAGNPAFTSPPDFDQRGPSYLRVDAGRIDVGAFELQASEFPTTYTADLDNDNGPSVYTENGTWATSGLPGYNGLSFRFGSVGSNNTATWTFTAPFAGYGEVSVQYRASASRATSALYQIDTGSGVETATVNQTQNSFTWVSLGTFYFQPGQRTITLNALLSSGGSVVNADVVRINLNAGSQSNSDFNDDNQVDGHDFLAWQRGLGTAVAAQHQQGDANGDGAVDGDDLALWSAAFGSSIAVPASGSMASFEIFDLMDMGLRASSPESQTSPSVSLGSSFYASDLANLALTVDLSKNAVKSRSSSAAPVRLRNQALDAVHASVRPSDDRLRDAWSIRTQWSAGEDDSEELSSGAADKDEPADDLAALDLVFATL